MDLAEFYDGESGSCPPPPAGLEQGFFIAPPDVQRELEEVRDELLGEINRLNRGNCQPDQVTAAPCLGNMGALFSEQNVACFGDQLVKNLNENSSWGWLSELIGGQGRGLIYGIGTAALLGILFPTLGEKVQTILFGTAMEGLELVQKTRSLVERTKEDIEDLIAEAGLRIK